MRHKSSPFVTLTAIKRLVEENPTNASQLTLQAVENNRYMDDILLACTSFNELQAIASEVVDLFRSRGFKLRKWVANSHAREILWDIFLNLTWLRPLEKLISVVTRFQIPGHLDSLGTRSKTYFE